MNSLVRTTVTLACVLVLPYASSVGLAQSLTQPQVAPQYPQEAPQAPPQLFGSDQLDNLVAPIALYPDPLLGQVLAASTYTLEIVEAQQWLQQNRSLQGQALIEAAKQQNWDPSIQVLVAFPDAMALVGRDIRWTTDLGNAFLAQQADVMGAIQRMRARASDNGRLTSTPQQIVTTQTQDQQSAIQIQPANPQVLYPPVYNPSYVWGPPATGTYPALSYPQEQYAPGYAAGYGPGYQSDYGSPGYGSSGYGPSGSGYGFGSGINLLGLFSGLLGGFGGWGWALNWFTGALSLVGSFFSSLGFHNDGYGGGGYGAGGGFGGRSLWVHNPAHRLGVPYSSGFLSARNRGGNFDSRMSNSRFSSTSRLGQAGLESSSRSASASRSASVGSGSGGWRTFGNSARTSAPSTSAVGRGFESGNQRAESYNRGATPASRGYTSPGGASSQNESSQHLSSLNNRILSSGQPQQMASNFRSTAQSNRAPAAESRFSAPRASSQNFSSRSVPARQNFSQPRASAPRVSAPHFSAPHGSSHVSAPHHSGGGGHSGGGHSSKSHKH